METVICTTLRFESDVIVVITENTSREYFFHFVNIIVNMMSVFSPYQSFPDRQNKGRYRLDKQWNVTTLISRLKIER